MCREAHRLIQQHGCTQGEYETDEGCLCLLGAFREISEAWYEGEISYPMVRALDQITCNFPHMQGIDQWNDRQGRTVDEVLDVLLLAAGQLEEQGQ